MSLDDLLATDAAATFLNSADFAEQITVSADGTVAGERTVYAIVDRSPPKRIEGGGQMRGPNLRVTLANHATLGIALSALNTGKSYIKVATDKGGTAKKEPLMGRPSTQDAGLLTFEW